MSDFLFLMFSVDTNSLTLVLMICGWGFLIMRSMLDSSGLAVASFPVLVLSALASHALFSNTGFIASLERGAGLAVTTGLGMTVSLLVIVVLMRIALLIKDTFGRRPYLLQQQR
jgi:hypothetical protein